MDTNKKHFPLHWVVLLSVVVNIFFNVLSSMGEINGQTNGEISHQHNTSFTPADFTFSIWSLIYLGYIIYAIAQALPSQREKPIYRQLALPFIAVNLLSVVWLFLFSYELMALSVLVIFAMLIFSIVLLHRVEHRHKYSFWLTIPFSLLSGWLSVAFLANIATWVASEGYRLTNDATIALIVLAALAGVVVNLRYRDWIYPLVIAWADFGIWSANRELNDRVAMVAIWAFFVLMSWAIVLLIIRAMKPSRLPDNYYN
jgi:hypothetical protein